MLLTRLGGGAFGNDDALVRALSAVKHDGLDIRLVSYVSHHRSCVDMAKRWGEAPG